MRTHLLRFAAAVNAAVEHLANAAEASGRGRPDEALESVEEARPLVQKASAALALYRGGNPTDHAREAEELVREAEQRLLAASLSDAGVIVAVIERLSDGAEALDAEIDEALAECA